MTHGNIIRNHAVKADVHRVRVGRKFWLFTFSDQWGPSLCDQWAEPLPSQSPLADEEHPFWDAFEAWLAVRLGNTALPMQARSAAPPPDVSDEGPGRNQP